MQIVGKHLRPSLGRLLQKIHAMVGARAVNQGVQPSPGLLDLLDQMPGGGGIGDVAAERQGLASPFDDGLARLGCLRLAAPVTNGDGPMLRGKVEGNRASDPSCSSRNESHAFGHGLFRFIR